jgi:diguanylate cyclase (GGDEF)-like protein
MAPGLPFSEAELAQLVFTDDLTGLFNRRYLYSFMELQLRPDNAPLKLLTLALFDVDRFKQINDGGGHLEGDRVLRELAALVRARFPPPAIPIRWAGDEFGLLLPGVAKPDAVRALEELRRAVESSATIAGGAGSPVTISVGLAAWPQDAPDPEALFVAADGALYQAKREGRNRVVCADRADPQVRAEGDAFAGLPCPTFVGRTQEIAEIDRGFDRALEGRPAFFLVTGGPGSGKTRLLLEAARRAQSRRMLYLYLACTDIDRGMPLHPIFYLIEQLAARDPRRLGAVLEGVSDAGLAAALDAVPTIQPCTPRRPTATSDDAARRRDLLEAIASILRQIAATEGLAVLFDHVQLLDSATAQLVAAFLSAPGARIVVAASLSSEAREAADFPGSPVARWLDELASLEGSRTLRLKPLEPAEVGAMVDAVFPGASFGETLPLMLAELGSGAPLYVEEALRVLLLRKKIVREGFRWKAEAISRDDLPAGLHDVIRSMLHAIPAEAGEILTNAAVVGDQFDLDVLKHAFRRSEGETQDLVDQIERYRLISPGDRVNEYRFLQPRVRRAQYDEADPKVRAEIHRRVGEFEAQRRARSRWRGTAAAADHFERSGDAARAAPLRAALLQLAQHLFAGDERAGDLAELVHARRLKVPEVLEPLSPEGKAQAVQVVRALTAGLHQLRLYPPESKTALAAIQAATQEIQEFLAGAPGITFGQRAGALRINGAEADRTSAAAELARLLDEAYIQSLTIRSGLHDQEAIKLLRKLAEPIKTVPPERYWDQFLTSAGIFHAGIHQRAFVASDDEGRTVIRIGAEVPLAAGTVPSMNLALRSMKAAIDNIKLYPPGSRVFKEGLDEFERGMGMVLATVPSVTIAAAGGTLLINGQPGRVADYGQVLEGMSKLLIDRLAQSVTVFRGVTHDQLSALVEALSLSAEEIRSQGGTAYWDRVAASGKLGRTSVGQRVYTVEQAATGAAAELKYVIDPQTGPGAEPRRVDPVTMAEELLSGPAAAIARLSPATWIELLETLAGSSSPELGRRLVDHAAQAVADADAGVRLLAAELINATLNAAPEGIRAALPDTWAPKLAGHARDEQDDEVLKVLWSASTACIDAMLAQTRPGPALDLLMAFKGNGAVTPTLRAAIDQAVAERVRQGRFAGVIDKLMSGDRAARRGALDICRFLGPAAADPLLQLIVTEADDAFRQEVLTVLLEATPDAADRLAERLDPAGEPEVQTRLLKLMPALGHEQAADAAIRALGHPAGPVRKAALDLAAQLPVGPASRVYDAALRSADLGLRAAALAAGAQRGLARMTPRIAGLLRRSRRAQEAKPLCEFLCKIGTPEAIRALAEVADHPKKFLGMGAGYADEMRALAVYSLGQINAPEAHHVVERMAQDKSVLVRAAAKAALGSGPMSGKNVPPPKTP